MPYILVLYYSQSGSTRALAEKIALGIEQQGIEAKLRTVPSVSNNISQTEPPTPSKGAPYVSMRELAECAGLALGSPTRFGNMASAMKYFWDGTSELWLQGALIDKPACVFTSSASMHGGQESTLLSMMLPLMHHGMLMCGLPYSAPELAATRSGGTPYGASHVSFNQSPSRLTDDEAALCVEQGKRIAALVRKLQ